MADSDSPTPAIVRPTSTTSYIVVDDDSEVADTADWLYARTADIQWLLTDLTQLLSGTQPDEFGLVCVQFQSVRRHPFVDSVNARQNLSDGGLLVNGIAANIGLQVICVSMNAYTMLLCYLHHLSSIHYEQQGSQNRTLRNAAYKLHR